MKTAHVQIPWGISFEEAKKISIAIAETYGNMELTGWWDGTDGDHSPPYPWDEWDEHIEAESDLEVRIDPYMFCFRERE